MSLPEVESAASLSELPAADVTVARAVVDEDLSAPRHADLDLIVPLTLDPAELPGAPVSITFERAEGGVARCFRLLVDAVDDHGRTRDGRRHLGVRASSALAGLARDHGTRIWYDATRSDAMRDVLDEAGLYRGSTERSLHLDPLRRHEHLTRYDERGDRFFRRMLEEDQCFAVLLDGPASPSGGAGDAVEGLRILAASRFASAALPASTFGDAPLELRAHDPTLEREVVHRLCRSHALGVASVEARDVDFTRPNHLAVMTARAEQAGGRGRVEATCGDGFDLGPYDAGALQYGLHDGARRVRDLLRASHADALRYQGRSNALGFAAHARFTVTTEDDVPLDLVATRVRHRFVAPEALALELVGAGASTPRYANDFDALPAGVDFAVRRTVPRPVARAVHTAFVVGASARAVNDVATEPYGRVWVELPYDLHRSSPGQRRAPRSCPLRVASPWAGPGRGLLFTPRVGDEVLIVYLDADPDRPLVVGSVYNAANRWPRELPSDAARVGLRTRSTPGADGYSELTVCDDVGREEVTLRAERDARAVVCNDSSAAVGRDRSETVGRNASLQVDGNAATAVRGNDRHEVGGALDGAVAGACTLDVGETLTLRAKERITLAVGDVTLDLTPTRATLCVGGGVRATFCGATKSAEVHAARGVFLTSDGQVEAHATRVVFNSPGHSVREKVLRGDDTSRTRGAGDGVAEEAPPGPLPDAARAWLSDGGVLQGIRAALGAMLPASVADTVAEALGARAGQALAAAVRDGVDPLSLAEGRVRDAVLMAVDEAFDGAGVGAVVGALQASHDGATRAQGAALGALYEAGRTSVIASACGGVSVASAVNDALAEHPAWGELTAHAPDVAGAFLADAGAAASASEVTAWCTENGATWQASYPTRDNPRGAVGVTLPEDGAGASAEVFARSHRTAVERGASALVTGGRS